MSAARKAPRLCSSGVLRRSWCRPAPPPPPLLVVVVLLSLLLLLEVTLENHRTSPKPPLVVVLRLAGGRRERGPRLSPEDRTHLRPREGLMRARGSCDHTGERAS